MDNLTNNQLCNHLLDLIANLHAPVELVITQVDGHVKMRLTSQLIKD